MYTRTCCECGKETALPGAMCRQCTEKALRMRCRSLTCGNNRAPGHQFCAECLENSSPEELKEALFNAFLQGMSVPEGAYERMCPEAKTEVQKEFCRRLTLQYVGRGRRRINWKRARRTAVFWGQAALMVVVAWAALVIIIGVHP